MKLKIPSLQDSLQKLQETSLRFPLELIFTTMFAGLSIYILEDSPADMPEILIKLLLTCVIAVPLFAATTIFSESQLKNPASKILARIPAFLILLAYFFLTPNPNDASLQMKQVVIRFILILAAVLTLLTIATIISRNFFPKKAESAADNSFWNFTAAITARFALSTISSIILYGGLMLALISIEKLLEIQIESETPLQIWIFIISIFNMIFFFSGLPADRHGIAVNYKNLEKPDDYRKELRLFVKFALLPLVLTYLAILYTYLGKILITQNWPDGWVAMPIIGFSVVGIATHLLIYPLQQREKNSWTTKFHTLFYASLIPVIPMLFAALWKRIEQYSITEPRYLGIVLGLWLIFLAFWFLIDKKNRIRMIPLSLIIALILSNIGPWSAFAVSEKSQVKRLEKILLEEEILTSAEILKGYGVISERKIFKKSYDQLLDKSHQKEISAIIDYLYNNHGFAGIQKWFTTDLILKEKDIREASYSAGIALKQNIMKEMGLSFRESWEREDAQDFSFFVSQPDEQIYEISSYDFGFRTGYDNSFVKWQGNTYEFYGFDKGSTFLRVNIEEKITFDIPALIKKLIEKKENEPEESESSFPSNPYHSDFPSDDLAVKSSSQNYQAILYLDNLSGTIKDDGTIDYGLQGIVFVKKR